MDRFLQKVDRGEGCWIWLAGKDKDGYGKFRNHGKSLQAHRASWERYYGPIPEGISVLHHCDNPPCVNPEHLFLGTDMDNVRDRDAKGRNGYSTRTYCPQGHEYSPANTTIWRGQRKCRACKRAYDAQRIAG